MAEGDQSAPQVDPNVHQACIPVPSSSLAPDSNLECCSSSHSVTSSSLALCSPLEGPQERPLEHPKEGPMKRLAQPA